MTVKTGKPAKAKRTTVKKLVKTRAQESDRKRTTTSKKTTEVKSKKTTTKKITAKKETEKRTRVPGVASSLSIRTWRWLYVKAVNEVVGEGLGGVSDKLVCRTKRHVLDFVGLVPYGVKVVIAASDSVTMRSLNADTGAVKE